MISQYVQQLRSSDPGVRRTAIIALGRSNDAAALQPLADIYRSDPDPALRELALKAGRHLKQQVGSAVPSAAAAAPAPKQASERIQRQVETYDEDDGGSAAPAFKLPQRVATPEEVARSRQYIDDALTQNERGDNGKAVRLLQRAIELNPDIIKDNFFISVAGTITDRHGEDAIAFLLDRQQATSFARQSERDKVDKRKSKHLELASETTWGGVALEAIIYYLINAGAIIIILLVIVQVMQNAVRDPSSISELGLDRGTMQSLNAVIGLSIAIIFVYGLVYGLFQTVFVFIYGALVHVLARYVFQGKGLMRFFLDKLIGFYNKRLPVYYGLILVATIVTFAAGAPVIAACVGIIAGFFSLWMLFQQTQVTAKAYDFGIAGGCLSHLIAGGLMGVAFFVLQLAVGASFSAMLQGMAR